MGLNNNRLALIIAVLTYCFSAGHVSAALDKTVCYYGTWATYRHANGKFNVENIDPTLCTHLIYTFVGIRSDGSVRHLDSYLDNDLGGLARTAALKLINPNLKVLIAIGGWGENSAPYSAVAADPQKRATLIRSALNLVQANGFDGFDIDWEYPGRRDGNPAIDKANFATLLKEFRDEWNKHPGLLLTAAVSATGSSVDISYDVPALSKYLDLINVMSYDLHGAWDGATGQNAPLYASSRDVNALSKTFNVDHVIRGWIARGAAPEKIVMGVGFYGQTYTLASTSNTGLGAPVSNGGARAKYTQQNGMMGYNEICESQLAGGWTTVWDDVQKTPYTYKGNQWVGYDDPKSIAIKVEYAKSLNLGGIMVWSIEMDDFKGICGQKFPLLNAIKTAISGTSNENSGNQGSSSSAPTAAPSKPARTTKGTTTTTTSSSNANPSDASDLCTVAGYIRDPKDCGVFYYCLPNNGKFVALKQSCSQGLVFDSGKHICNYPSLVEC